MPRLVSCDGQLEQSIDRSRGDANGLSLIRIGDGVASRIGEELLHLASITVDGLFSFDRDFDYDARPRPI